MALADYFDKSALAASQILQGYDKEAFQKKLEAAPIELAFDGDAVQSMEGIATLDLVTRLLSRLYPHVIIEALEIESNQHQAELELLAKSINPVIDLDNALPVATIVVGNKMIEREGPIFYIGSNEWSVKFSPNLPVGSGTSENPFGAGAAACFGAANVFRIVFRDQLHHGETDHDFNLSLVNFERSDESTDSIHLDRLVQLHETFLVGLGAIGNAALWALGKIKKIEGTLHVIDHETIERSNLQRYVLAAADDVHQDKITMCHRYDGDVVKPYKGTWASFLNERKNWHLPIALLAVDSAEDRIAIQSSLPHLLINAWTQPSDLGISRHLNFNDQPCVACLYPPKMGLPTKAGLVADALGLTHRETEVREMLYNDAPMNEQWIKEIAGAKDVDFETLTPFIGLPISKFYTQVICGGMISTTANDKQTETPMAFQSALAGILLASELVIHQTQLRTVPIANITRIDLLKPLKEFLNEPLAKPAGVNCICQDNDFKTAYQGKYLPGKNTIIKSEDNKGLTAPIE